MLGQKSKFARLVRHLVVLVFLFSAVTVVAQSPRPAVEKTNDVTVAPVGAVVKEASIPSEKISEGAVATKPPPDIVKSEADSKKTDEVPKAEPEVAAPPAPAPMQAQCQRTVKADVVALAQPIFLNRLGTVMPGGMVFALRRDTVGGQGMQLRADKRARPLVLRANVGDCIEITLTNNIPAANFKITQPAPTPPGQPYQTPEVSLHVQGMEWVTGAKDDGSFVGKNDSSLASPNPTSAPPPGTQWPSSKQTYTLFAKAEGTFLMYSMGDTTSIGSHITNGLFGALNVQPSGAEWYRSQVTKADLKFATTSTTPDNHPIVNYNATYPAGATYPDGTAIPPNTPVLKMLDSNLNIVHTDLTAIITGPNAGRFTQAEANCDAGAPIPPNVDPLFCKNPASPDRRQPYREITTIYHGALGSSLDGTTPGVATQAFPILAANSPVRDTTVAGQDAFAINYGTGGIGAEIYANRIGVGPMGDCADCKFEEFFLSAWSVGDPAMVVDRPANVSILNQKPPLASTPAAPALAPPPPICTAAQLGDNAPTPPDPNCANSRVPIPPGTPYSLAELPKATRAYYPDDPSNVFHSYINDHVKFRILHGGRDVSHVHHQHAHQWLQSPNSDQGSYLDSQMISPGASYTLEMVYNGSGNRNKVVGDSIFHCHFYPHFAAGMWAMWRTHDTFEPGTDLQNGIPIKGTRALPDGEISAGTPMPALVPMPTLPMAPMPSPVFIENGQIVFGTTATPDPTGNNVTVNPGFPFFIPGVAGARAPHPPLDFAKDSAGIFMDGGLPRHVVTGGTVAYESHDTKDWSKDLATINAVKLPEDGTKVEQVAMQFFGKRCHPSFLPDGTVGSCPSSISTPPQSTLINPPTGFLVNGLPRKNAAGSPAEQLGATPGAPFADPAVDDNGVAVGTLRRYKAAAIQANVTFNKKKLGWHYPQQRLLSLWEDVSPTIQFTTTGGTAGRQPEPLFFRGNTGDIIEYWHTNLVPNYYNVDDFQVRTPTDILGQHIHLVKFDVTASDGAGNGFNYEDGTFAPGEVQEIIRGINHSPTHGFVNFPNQPLLDPADPQYKVKYGPPKEIFDCSGNTTDPRCLPCPELTSATSRPVCQSWLGAQTTIQRWYIDPLVDNANVDRTLRTVFTHDHFGPSTHQQAGLYAGLLVEPQGSTWTGNDGTPFFTRDDGGPTSWQARILTTNPADSYREFMLEFQDLQLAYTQDSTKTPNANPKIGWSDVGNAINPPCIVFTNGKCSTSMPSLITTGVNALPAGTQSVNYTNEPVAARLGGSSTFPPPDKRSDLSYMFDNSVVKSINSILPPAQQALAWAPDPMTPLMRAYQGDKVQIRLLVGAHVFQHQFNFQGPVWFSEPSWKNSGYRSAQATGLSEHFELLFKVPSSSAPSFNRRCPDEMSNVNCVDYLYSPSFDESGISNGLWGIFRAYDPDAAATDPILTKVVPLPNNPIAPGNNVTYNTCPANATPRSFDISAVTAQAALPNGQLVFNGRGGSNILQNRQGIMYVHSKDLTNGKLNPGVPIEPIVLRANAGDCVTVKLTNLIAPSSSVLNTNFSFPPPFTGTVNPHIASSYVGIHPQLLAYDAASSSGVNVGWNREGQPNNIDQTVGFNKSQTYKWYAGTIERDATGALAYTPVEFGALNLFPSDVIFQNPNGLFGQMIVEPPGATWTCDPAKTPGSCEAGAKPPSRTSATVKLSDSTEFREFSLMIGDSIRINGTNTGAVNYRTEPWSFRYRNNTTGDFSCMLSNQLLDPDADPVTPLLTANVGDKVRFRMTHPFGTGTSQVFSLHGHVWQRNPYINNSKQLGNNILSQWIGSRDNHGSSDHFDVLIDKAGGEGGKAGDYLYSVFVPTQARDGVWGIFRVGTVPNPTIQNAGCPAKPSPGYSPPTKLKDGTERFTRQPLPIMRPNN